MTDRRGLLIILSSPSGAGKSSVFNVLTRLVDVEGGRVSVGGVVIDALSLEELRGLFSVVSQDAPMFDESLRDNILLAETDVSDARLAEVLEAAHLTEFVARLPQGLDTILAAQAVFPLTLPTDGIFIRHAVFSGIVLII